MVAAWGATHITITHTKKEKVAIINKGTGLHYVLVVVVGVGVAGTHTHTLLKLLQPNFLTPIITRPNARLSCPTGHPKFLKTNSTCFQFPSLLGMITLMLEETKKK